MRFVLPPLRRPRHPLARALLAVLGAVILGALLAFGLLAVLAFLAVGAVAFLARQLTSRPQAPMRPQAQAQAGARGDVIEGEFVVVRDPQRHR